MLQVSAISNSNQLWMNHQEGVSEDILHQLFFTWSALGGLFRVSRVEILHIFTPNVCSQEVVIDLRPETYTQSLSNAPNENSVVLESNASNVQTNGKGIKESKRNVALSADSLDSENKFILSGSVTECWKSNVITFLDDGDKHMNNQFLTFGISASLPNIAITLKRRGNITDFVIIRKTLSFCRWSGMNVLNVEKHGYKREKGRERLMGMNGDAVRKEERIRMMYARV
ncbi:hypothetical protein TNCV_3023051 [Trichonephila clavipes]|nr:hypothetical protein TNCV_3023051 [Trichonephila clavipes]